MKGITVHLSRIRRTTLGVGALVSAVLVLAGCASPSAAPAAGSADETPVAGGVLNYLTGAEPGTWDAQKVPGLALLSINSSIFDTVITQDADGSYKPGLATAWEVSPDGLTYTFTLREGVTFHDGTPFDAAALETNLLRPTRPDSGLNPGLPIASTSVIDPTTLQVVLSRPYATTIHALSTPHIPIYSPAVLAAHSNAEIGADPKLSVGTGPFEVASYTRGSKLVLQKNPDYAWAPATLGHSGPAYLDTVEIQFVPEPQARVGAFTSGQTQAIDSVPPLNGAQITAGDRRTILEADNAGLPYTLSLNTNVAPFDDLAVRQAFRSAIDIDGILKSVYAGFYDKASSVVTPNTPPNGSYDAALEGSWTYDPAAAAKLLDAAGWSTIDSEGYRTKDGVRLSLKWKDDSLYIQNDQRQQLAEAIVASVKESGIEVVRTQYDTAGYTAELAKNEHHIAPSSRGYADIATPTSVFAAVADPRGSGSKINYGLTNDADINAWYGEIVTSSDPARRAELGRLVQNRVNEEVYGVPVYVPKKLVGVDKTVHGWRFDIVGYTDTFYDVWLTPAK